MRVELTKYYLTAESDYPPNYCVPIKDVNMATIAVVDPHFYASAALEGSCRLRSGSVLNVSGHWIPVDGKTSAMLQDIADRLYRGKLADVGLSRDCSEYLSFYRSLSPWGTGAYQNTNLMPFVSCAVDRSVIPLGSKLFCPALQGKTMPDSTEHQGYLWAHDTGGAIKGNHIDWFCGTKSWAKAVESIYGDSIEVEILT